MSSSDRASSVRGFRGTVHGPGNYGPSPFRNQVINIDTRPSTRSESFQVLVKDDLTVSFQIHAVMSVEPDHAQQVVEEYAGNEWYERFVKEPFRTIVRRSAQKYSSRELKSERDALGCAINTELSNYLKDTPFRIVRLAVGNIDYRFGYHLLHIGPWLRQSRIGRSPPCNFARPSQSS